MSVGTSVGEKVGIAVGDNDGLFVGENDGPTAWHTTSAASNETKVIAFIAGKIVLIWWLRRFRDCLLSRRSRRYRYRQRLGGPLLRTYLLYN